MNKHFAVAIDGPAGAGKTTTAKAIAQTLGFTYMDTGKIYRAVAVAITDATFCGLQLEDVTESWLSEHIHELAINMEPDSRVTISVMGKTPKTIPDDRLRTEPISIAASTLSKYPCVRHYLLGMQRDAAMTSDVVMEGRDIGTVVLPDADVKFFLTASDAACAKRRVAQLQKQGKEASYDDVFRQLIARNKQDSERETAPLKKADDAFFIDNTYLTQKETVAYMTEIIRRVIRKQQDLKPQENHTNDSTEV